jgi:type IV pilus biogenesis protein CpaD/CtpE
MKIILNKALPVIAVLLLAIPLVLTGCTSKDPVAADVLKNTTAAMSKISSYKADIDMKMDMTIIDGSDTQKATVEMTGTASADMLKKNSQMNMDVDLDIPGSNTQKATEEAYVVDGWDFMKTNMPGAADTWNKMKIPATLNQDQIAQLTALMKTAVDSSLQGTETVNGTDCYVIKVNADMAALWKWLSSQQGSSLTNGIDFSKLDLSKIIKDFGLKYWVAKKGYQIVKAEAEINMNIDASDLGVNSRASGSMTMLMNMDMTFSDYNKAVNIVLPAEAKNAKEITTP